MTQIAADFLREIGRLRYKRPMQISLAVGWSSSSLRPVSDRVRAFLAFNY